ALFVLEADDEIVGYSAILESGPRGLFGLAMAILEGHRGRGGGRGLLDAAVERARTLGAHKVELEVWPDNGRAIALYVAAGFEVEGFKRDHYRRRDGSLRSSVVMGLRLAS